MMKHIKVFTIGFTRKTAEEFFTTLIRAGVKRVIDIRLNNTSQLAGFTKKENLQYFLRVIGNIDYIHRPDLAPTSEILAAYKGGKGGWSEYEHSFKALMEERRPERNLDREFLDRSCLLCTEPAPEHCHRRLVADWLAEKVGEIDICHL